MTRRRDPPGLAFRGACMADDSEMRFRLQQVAAYRDLCRRVRRSGRENIVFAAIMLFLAYFLWKGAAIPLLLSLYVILAVGELLVGVFKWVAPSAEGVLFDAIVLLVFAAFNFGVQYLRFQQGFGFNPIILFLGVYMLMLAVGRFKDYRVLRLLFAERPSAEHMAWFDELVREIKAADPEADEQAIDLPTRPHWKAKLLGTLAFFVAARSDDVVVVGPDDFELRRERVDRGTGRRKAVLRLHDLPYPEFEITDATWANYQRWRAAHPLPGGPPTAVGGAGT
jgi:hypothetical protein